MTNTDERSVGDETIRSVAMDAARSRLTGRLRTRGLVEGERGIRLEHGTAATIILSRVRTTIHGLDVERIEMPIGEEPPHLDAFDLERLDRVADRHARRLARLRALRDAGHERGVDPTWSMSTHALARALLVHHDVDPALAVADPRGSGHLIFAMVAEGAGLRVGTRRIDDGRLDVSSIETPGMTLVGDGRPAILIETELPHATVAALRGRLLAEAIDHPAVRAAGPMRIEEATTGDGATTIVLPDRQAFLRRAPKGVRRDWNRIPYAPRHDD